MAATVTFVQADGTAGIVVTAADETGAPPTGWSTAKLEAGGGTPGAAVADGNIEGTGAVTTTSNNKRMVLYFDIGAGNELDFSSGGTEEGNMVYIWGNMISAALLELLATGGFGIFLGSAVPTTSQHDLWYFFGNDNYAGGWKRMVLDPTKPPSVTVGTTLNLASVRYFGVFADTTATARFDNLISDQIAVGVGLKVTGTVSAEGLVADLLADEETNRDGIVLSLNDPNTAAGLNGQLILGDDTAATNSTITDSDSKLFLEEPLYYDGANLVPSVPKDFFSISCIGGTGTQSITMGSKVGTGDTASGRSGLTIVGNDSYNLSIDFDDGNVNTNNWYGCTFENVSGSITWGTNALHECIGNTFNACHRFDPVEDPIIRACRFLNYSDNAFGAALLWNDNIDIKNCSFIANDDLTSGSPYSAALEHPTNVGSPYTHTGLTFSGNERDVFNSMTVTPVKETDNSTLPAGNSAGVSVSPEGTLCAVPHVTTPFVTIYNTLSDPDFSAWTKVTNPSTLPTGTGEDTAFSPDGSLLAVAHDITPFVTIYNTSDWSKVTNPSTLPAGTGRGVCFSPDGSLMAVAHTTSPFITIYNTSDWSKVTNPSTLPASTGTGCSFNEDGSLLAVSHATTPFVTLYRTSDWSKVANPSTLPAGTGRGVHFSPEGEYLAVSHQTTPFVTIYNTSDWSKVTNPSTLPAGDGYRGKFNNNGTLLAIPHDTTPFVTIYNTSDWSKVTNPSSLPAGLGRGCHFFDAIGMFVVGHTTTPYITVYDNSTSISISLATTSNATTSKGGATTITSSVPIEVNGVTEGTSVKVIANETVGTITTGDVIFQKFADSTGTATEAAFTYEAAFEPSGLDVIVRAASSGTPNAAIADDNGVFTDETGASNSSTIDDMNLLPATPVVNQDRYLFGHFEQFGKLLIDISTAGTGGFTITWEYWNGSGWSSLTGVTDDTSSFANLGLNYVSWTIPGGWATTTINSQGPYYYVRASYTAGTVTITPKGRFTDLDVTSYIPFEQSRIVSNTGLEVVANWQVDTIKQL